MRPVFYITVFIMAVLLLPFACGDGQGKSEGVVVSAKAPVIDGTVAAGEYSFTQDYRGCTLYAARNKDTITLAIKANTTGWVAIGVGSTVMNDAHIVIGFVKDGKPQLKEQLGAGHGHHDTSAADSGVLDMAIKEENGTTTLEVSLRAGDFIRDGQKELAVIIAYSSQASFMVRHSFRTGIVLQLQ